MATTNGPLFDLQYLSYIGDLKARNKMCLRPIDIAKMHGYKDCVNYLATLEACLSLAEQNIALETELLHYGAELSELEKCFNELLQLAKSERHQVQGSYFGSVVEAIERKWKRCKSKSLGSHGLPDQNAYNLFQSHFSRILTDDVLSELSFSSSPNHQHHHQSFFQQHHHHNRFSNHLYHHHHQHNHATDANRYKVNGVTDNLTGLLGGDRTTVKNKCNSNGYTPNYSDPFLELSNGHYSLFSSDTDYAVPYKIKTGPKNKAGMKKSDNQVILGRRGLKQQRDQPEGSSVPSYPKSSSSLYEPYKHHDPSSSPPSASRDVKGDFEDIDLDLDLDDEDDELSGYSSLKLRPSPQTSSSGSKGSPSNQPIMDQVDSQHSSQPKGSQRGLIVSTTENLSEPESKTSDGRESSINGSISTKENYSAAGESDSASVSRKRGFLHKFSLRKWATSTASKPKKSYSKETLLRSTGGEGTVREEVSDEGKGSSNETSSNDGCEKGKSCKPSNGKLAGGDEKETNNWWPSSHEIQSKDTNAYEKDNGSVGTKKMKETKSTESTNHLSSNCNNKILENSTTSSTLNPNNKETCSNSNLVNSSSKLSSVKKINNYVNNENTDKQQKQVSPKGVDRSQSPINKSKVNYCRLTNDKIRSASMEAIDFKPEANHHHYQVNTDNYSLIATKSSTSVIKESKLIGRSSTKSTNDQNDINNDTIDSIQQSPPNDEFSETLTSAQSVPILSNSVYGVKHVKKAKIKELSPLNYEELTPASQPPPPSPSIGNVAMSTKLFENRKKMFEKGPGNKNTRGLRRRRNGNRAWYDVSDDEDGLVPQKFNQEKVTETQEPVDC